jgi:hypothetical protein
MGKISTIKTIHRTAAITAPSPMEGILCKSRLYEVHHQPLAIAVIGGSL